MDRVSTLALLLGVLGVALLAAAVAMGGAHLYLVLIVPVATGSSPLFLGGFLLVVAAMLLAALGGSRDVLVHAPVDREEPLPRAGASVDRPADRGSSGVVLIGPFPFFFGAWKGRGRRWTALWAAVGALLLALVVVAALLISL